MDCDPTDITRALVESYQTLGGINHLEGVDLPAKLAVSQVCSELLQIIFPGFYETESLHSANLTRHTDEAVREIISRLRTEVRRSLAFKKLPEVDPDGAAHRLVCRFMRMLPEVRALLRTDVQAAFDGDPAAGSYEEVILAYPGLEAIAIQRMAHVLYNASLPFIPRMMTEWAHNRTGIDIHPGARIGTHFFIDHGTGVVIGETTVIGNHVKLYQGVGLVARSLAAGQRLRGKVRHPQVEDNVTIYANATIVGDITVGRGTTLGANVFVVEDVPPDSVVTLGELKHEVRAKHRVAAVPPR
ncbi:MAG: Serine O-acetyltransferase [Verrucomicrobiales bacterium]|nr:Serine O-acetyltransferase [Verrucomicrobiales bacterium]RYD31455.1 MAG: serine acetyltransferase [Verrucomicrobiaceae bacterium]